VLDLEPHGPLPTQIYWRRRALAIGIAVLVIGVVAAVVVMIVMNSTSTEGKTADKPNPTQAAAPTPLPGENPEVKTPVMPPAQQALAPTPTPTAAVMPPPVLKEGDDCPDSTLAVKGITNQPQYFVGDQPKFTMVVTNIGLVACQRDVGAAVLAAYVYSLDNNRLWSNLDCAPSNETLVKTFQPGEQVTTEVTWTGGLCAAMPAAASADRAGYVQPRRAARQSEVSGGAVHPRPARACSGTTGRRCASRRAGTCAAGRLSR
jgi:hypothetical protein